MILQFKNRRKQLIFDEVKNSLRHFVYFVLIFSLVVIVCLIAESKHTTFLTFDEMDFNYQHKPTAKPFNESFQYNVLLNGHCHTNVGKLLYKKKRVICSLSSLSFSLSLSLFFSELVFI
jgi:hypothetical protein